MQLIGDIFDDFGVPFSLTRRGALTAELPGKSANTDRALVVHADTIGCMVRGLKDNGRLELIPVGTFSARFATGARVRIFSDDPDEFITGTVMPLKASGHAFGDEIDTQPTDWEHVEVRVDRKVSSRDDLVQLGLKVGDFVAFVTSPELAADGFIVSRHLDGKAGVAVALALAKNFAENKVVLPHRTMIMVTITEEVGHGASDGLPADVAELDLGGQRGVRARPALHRGRCDDPDGRSARPVRLPPHPQAVPARRGARHTVRARCVPLLPIRRRRGDRGGRGHAGRAGRLRARRQPRLGAHPHGLAGGDLQPAARLAADAADVRQVGRQAVGQATRLPVVEAARADRAVGAAGPRRPRRTRRCVARFALAAVGGAASLTVAAAHAVLHLRPNDFGLQVGLDARLT